ncbi:MAG: hypothetical protein CV045_03635 [Cyanobacteria bacterium M5B4]|nr:MAG: hypothetical protein CV045_03635 [Cyanobacteria bacterium M5B4]
MFLQGDIPSAVNSLQRSIGLNPNLSDAHFTLGIVYSKTGRKKEAIAALTTALNLYQKQQNQVWIDRTKQTIQTIESSSK